MAANKRKTGSQGGSEAKVPERVRKLAAESKQYFRHALGEFIYYRTYSRWIEAEGRRETWLETVDRYLSFMRERLGSRLEESEYARVRESILCQKVMPSMRLLWSAGAAARATGVAAYNCAYIAPSRIEDLAEIMYLLMCGTGVGFSVESRSAQLLPEVLPQSGRRRPTHQIQDSREGWCAALLAGLHAWFGGEDLDFEFSLLRLAGARLHTMGGRSSGPAPFREALVFLRAKVLASQGRRLRNIDLHDMICKIGEAIVMGGVRRAALISLSDFGDELMRSAKTGRFYLDHPERAMANDSAVYLSRPSREDFSREWKALSESGTGERGIFNRGSLERQLPARRWPVFAKDWAGCGTNPCGEIILKSKQFCNLTEVVARPEDDEAALLAKVEVAALLGTYQATFTDFPYLSPDWKRNCEEERLLGVSLTGLWDSALARQPAVLARLRERAVEANRQYAARFGIREATAVTCVKPSGTVSQLVDSASGMHPRHAPYYLRRVRISALDPLFLMLKEQGFPYKPEAGQQEGSATIYVLEFPVKAPPGAIHRKDLTVREQLEFWLGVKRAFTEHNPSVTVLVGRGEWAEAERWLYDNWESLGGLSFLPKEETLYELAPFEEISREQYEALAARLPAVDFSQIIAYEQEDRTTGAHALACSGNSCELDPEELHFTPPKADED